MRWRVVTAKKKILIVSILGDDEVLPKGLFDGAPEGRTDLEWMARRVRKAGLGRTLSLSFVDISQGDTLPPVADFDAVMVGGSIHNVNEDRVWQRRGIEWLQRWRQIGRPLFGMCGGHQMASVALGGSVAVMAQGPNASTEAIELTDAGRRHFMFNDCGNNPSVHLGHFDHVDRPPNGASELARFRGINMALDMGGGWLTVQFHPEANANLMVMGWGGELGDLDGAYHQQHAGQTIIANFLTGVGLA